MIDLAKGRWMGREKWIQLEGREFEGSMVLLAYDCLGWG